MLSRKQEQLFSHSLDISSKSNMLFKHGCVATYGGHIIASGYNTHKNYSAHDDFIDNQCSFHAEMDVLRKIYWRNTCKKWKRRRILRRTTLYISRSSNNGSSTNSAPCAKCLHMIQSFNIRKIIFYKDNGYHECDPKTFETDHKTFGDLGLIRNQ